MQLLKIKDCKDPMWWYNNHIGQSFELDRVQKDGSFIVYSNQFNDLREEIKACVAKEDGFIYKLTICEDCE